jgi:hypothetical protein
VVVVVVLLVVVVVLVEVEVEVVLVVEVVVVLVVEVEVVVVLVVEVEVVVTVTMVMPEGASSNGVMHTFTMVPICGRAVTATFAKARGEAIPVVPRVETGLPSSVYVPSMTSAPWTW